MLYIHVCAHKFFRVFLRVYLGLSTENNPKKHMGKISIKGKEDETKEVEKEELLLCNTKGLLTVILRGFLQNTKGHLTIILKDSLLFYISSSCWYFSLVSSLRVLLGFQLYPL